ncbi:hypothetical protein BWD08_00960 [Neisseria animaloris]|nr:hypothetical protein BWD08_00960 [Neisseria animaloris]
MRWLSWIYSFIKYKKHLHIGLCAGWYASNGGILWQCGLTRIFLTGCKLLFSAERNEKSC